MKNNDPCNFLASPLSDASEKESLYARLRDKAQVIFYTIYARLKYNYLRRNALTESQDPQSEPLNLQPGEWVEIKSMREISATLDERGRHKGLYFMPEMEKFCGKKFKIFKKVEVIKLESTGELRKLKSPTIFLDGVFCDGEHQGGCHRSCFHFWREEWLRKDTYQSPSA